MLENNGSLIVSHVKVVGYEKPQAGNYTPLVFYCRLPNGWYVSGSDYRRLIHPRDICEMVESGTLYPLAKEVEYRASDLILVDIAGRIYIRRIKMRRSRRPGEFVDQLPG